MDILIFGIILVYTIVIVVIMAILRQNSSRKMIDCEYDIFGNQSQKENQNPQIVEHDYSDIKTMISEKRSYSHIPTSILEKLPIMVKAELAKMPPEKQGIFMEEFRKEQKSMGLAYFLWFILGVHYVYLGKIGWQLVYWFTVGGALIWMIVDLFRIPAMVGNHNKDVSIEIIKYIRILTGSYSSYLGQ